MSSIRTWLLPVTGGDAIEISKELTLVGRQENCDLKLDHKTVSKAHCVLVKGDGTLMLRDLGSTNGCRINGQRVLRGALLPNDILSIAVFDYRLNIGVEDFSASRNEPPQQERTEMISRMDVTPKSVDLPDPGLAADRLPARPGA